LAEISKISAVAIANVAKVDAVTKANIADINGLTVPSGFTGLLDETYGSGAAAAYSVRRLASATTVLLRVRRDTAGGTGDDDEADVAYDSNNELSLDSAISNASTGVTATTLGQFINVGTVGGTTYTNPDSLTVTASCFVDEWKDQSGNTNHASQSTQASQPEIHSGTVNTDLITDNGKPALDFGQLELTTLIDSQLYSYFMVNALGNALRTLFLRRSGVSTYLRADSSNKYVIVTSTDFDSLSGSTFDGTQALNTLIASSSTTVTSFQNGSQTGTISSLGGGNMQFDLMERNMTVPTTNELLTQEMIFYTSDVGSSNRTGIETDINGYYSIY